MNYVVTATEEISGSKPKNIHEAIEGIKGQQ